MPALHFDWDEYNLAKCLARCSRQDIERLLSDPETLVVPILISGNGA